jgi:hypothetical protein
VQKKREISPRTTLQKHDTVNTEAGQKIAKGITDSDQSFTLDVWGGLVGIFSVSWPDNHKWTCPFCPVLTIHGSVAISE